MQQGIVKALRFRGFQRFHDFEKEDRLPFWILIN